MNESVYLAGGMAGLEYDEIIKWRKYVSEELGKSGIVTFSPLRAKGFLAGKIIDKEAEQNKYTLGKAAGITARDRNDLMNCGLVFMNLVGCEERFSIGSCIELGWADAFRKPVVLVCEKGGVFDKHPMVEIITGFKVYSIDEGIFMTKAVLLDDWSLEWHGKQHSATEK